MEQSIEYDWEYIEVSELKLSLNISANKILQEEQQKRQEEKELIEKAELDLIEDLFTNNNKQFEVKFPVNNEEKEEVSIKSVKSRKKRKQTSKNK